MNVKKCTVEPIPEPPSASPCKLQRIKQFLKAGKKICPVEPPPEIIPPPPCHALCIEKIKNFPFPLKKKDLEKCIVERDVTGFARCDEIFERTASKEDLPWPGCPAPPPPPPPPRFDPCEEQRRREKREECKRRMRRYME